MGTIPCYPLKDFMSLQPSNDDQWNGSLVGQIMGPVRASEPLDVKREMTVALPRLETWVAAHPGGVLDDCDVAALQMAIELIPPETRMTWASYKHLFCQAIQGPDIFNRSQERSTVAFAQKIRNLIQEHSVE
jgi:hypothetical protein